MRYACHMDVQTFLNDILIFINERIVPLLLAVAFLVFIWNVARYFIIGGADEQNRQKAKRLALYGIGAFVFIVCIWGIVNLFVSGLGFDRQSFICPDYNLNCNGEYGP